MGGGDGGGDAWTGCMEVMVEADRRGWRLVMHATKGRAFAASCNQGRRRTRGAGTLCPALPKMQGHMIEAQQWYSTAAAQSWSPQEWCARDALACDGGHAAVRVSSAGAAVSVPDSDSDELHGAIHYMRSGWPRSRTHHVLSASSTVICVLCVFIHATRAAGGAAAGARGSAAATAYGPATGSVQAQRTARTHPRQRHSTGTAHTLTQSTLRGPDAATGPVCHSAQAHTAQAQMCRPTLRRLP